MRDRKIEREIVFDRGKARHGAFGYFTLLRVEGNNA